MSEEFDAFNNKQVSALELTQILAERNWAPSAIDKFLKALDKVVAAQAAAAWIAEEAGDRELAWELLKQ